jgi:hypothetical protein
MADKISAMADKIIGYALYATGVWILLFAGATVLLLYRVTPQETNDPLALIRMLQVRSCNRDLKNEEREALLRRIRAKR